MLQKPTSFFFRHGPKAVILLHAYASNSNDMRLLARFLEKDDYSVYAPILTGHATDDPRDIFTQGSPEQWWQDTKGAIEYVRSQGYTQIAIFGLSLGGIFATKALEEDSDLVGGGTFSSPIISAGGSNVAESFPKMAQAQYERQQTDQETKQVNLTWIKEHVSGQLLEIETYTKSIATRLEQINTIFFVGQGGRDEMISSKCGAMLQQRLEQLGKQVDFHFYPDASHVITVNSAHHNLEQDVKTI
ncbi:alpha/beta hydrolase [Paucilactobacillus hokkaidonensis]|uniref:alpha/beta hydrolase n=1 Tax=Paucilactobacillus hokkaidonensis TaxID=1193095 RepID=UPI0006D05D22|nr:alpha/beta fold hydrolase [Paucilactobacillus hokkaidonensis]